MNCVYVYNKKHNIKIYYTYDTCTRSQFYDPYDPISDLPMHLAMYDILKHVDFFEALAETSMLSLSSPHSQYGSANVFMIQLPKPDRAKDALDIIRRSLHK